MKAHFLTCETKRLNLPTNGYGIFTNYTLFESQWQQKAEFTNFQEVLHNFAILLQHSAAK